MTTLLTVEAIGSAAYDGEMPELPGAIPAPEADLSPEEVVKLFSEITRTASRA